MIGRAAQGNPWIFGQTVEYLEHGTIPKKPELSEVKAVILRHANLQMQYKSELTAMREMRKHVSVVHDRISTLGTASVGSERSAEYGRTETAVGRMELIRITAKGKA